MIIRWYLIRQVVSTSLVVIALLTMIMLGGRLIRYFGVAAEGRLDASILLSIIAYRLPEFLTLILPLGFFVSLLLVFGRLYVDHEMAVFNASGVSRGQLGRKLIPLTLIVFLLQSALMITVSPWGIRQFEHLTTTHAIRSGFDLVKPREFVSAGPYTIYAGSLSEDRKDLQDVFFFQEGKKADKPDVIILAERATRLVTNDNSASIVDLTKGRRYEIYPDQPKYSHAEFQQYRLRLEHDITKQPAQSVESMRVMELLEQSEDPAIQSELGWRFSAPFIIFLALLLALPLSEVNPRQGRYQRLFPAILIFASLIVALMAVKTRVSKGELNVWFYALILIGYAVAAILFAKRKKLAPKIKHRLGVGAP